jgi:mannosyltransferase OCH1-like enzyme
MNNKQKLRIIVRFVAIILLLILLLRYFFNNVIEKFTEEERIPKTLHQIWIGTKTPPTKWINRWKDDYCKKYPDFNYIFWNEEKINKELNWSPKIRKMYDEEKEMYGKADIARLLILNQYGGIYIDADSIWVNDKNLDDIIQKAQDEKTNFFVGKEPNKDFVANSVIGSIKNHPALVYLLQELENMSNDYNKIRESKGVWEVTGPILVNKAVLEKYPITVLPPVYFYPYPWHGTQKKDIDLLNKMPKEAYMYHYGYTTNNYLDF